MEQPRKVETVYDYEHQAWVIDGRYVRCGHAPGMNCECYGRLHEGEVAEPEAEATWRSVALGGVELKWVER